MTAAGRANDENVLQVSSFPFVCSAACCGCPNLCGLCLLAVVTGVATGWLPEGGTALGGWNRLEAEGAIEVFRRQVEAIREQGGSTWLASLNQMHSPLLHKRKKIKVRETSYQCPRGAVTR